VKVENLPLEKKYHDAVEHWRRHWMPDYDTLLDQWEQYFPKDERFCLCAKLELGTPERIQVGDHQGRLVERPEQVFPGGDVHARLAPDRRIDHREQRGRDLDVGDAA